MIGSGRFGGCLVQTKEKSENSSLNASLKKSRGGQSWKGATSQEPQVESVGLDTRSQDGAMNDGMEKSNSNDRTTRWDVKGGEQAREGFHHGN